MQAIKIPLINKRWFEGFVIARCDGRTLGIYSDTDYPIKILEVKVELNDEINQRYDLVAYGLVETVFIELDGHDKGYLTDGIELYRMPFPYDFQVRKYMMRQMRQFPKFDIDPS